MSNPTAEHWRMEVEWLDSTVLIESWRTIEEVLSRRDAPRCVSVGFILADDEKGIVLASSIHGNEAAGVVMIPAQAIVRRKRLR